MRPIDISSHHGKGKGGATHAQKNVSKVSVPYPKANTSKDLW